jgi:glycine C-acetyltransferase
MNKIFLEYLNKELETMRESGLLKEELVLASPQDREIKLESGEKLLNFCVNNYLGLSNHPDLIRAAKEALDRRGYGLSSVRFICGTQDLHKRLEEKISSFFGTEDTILYAACFDANGGLFNPLLTEEDAVISDALNHASIIDGVRLCKAKRYMYKSADMADLENKLQQAQDQRFRLIATDGVFSMDGHVAPLGRILELAEKYDSLVMVDECHSAGVVGASGRGVTEMFDVRGRVDIITGTLGKAFGGAIGGFTTGRGEIIALLRQKSRPYLFSNTLPPHVAAAGLRAIELLEESTALVDRLRLNRDHFISRLKKTGFSLKPTNSAICAVLLGEERVTRDFAAKLRADGIYVIAFAFPIVPRGEARIRVQISAAHTTADLDHAVEAFCRTGRDLGISCPPE